jgi:hypothetical protein
MSVSFCNSKKHEGMKGNCGESLNVDESCSDGVSTFQLRTILGENLIAAMVRIYIRYIRASLAIIVFISITSSTHPIIF